MVWVILVSILASLLAEFFKNICLVQEYCVESWNEL